MTALSLAERTEILAPTGLTPLLSTAELRAHFDISLWTVNEWRKAGCPVRLLPGGRRRFDLAAVNAWLDQRGEAIAQINAEKAAKAVAGRS
ncbi:hypothetical protein [Streptomyces flaveolus]|uniref:hypothetical protein n=1 Tax=Streptomyces flaveolus TaxID=67297 RepID=UPI0034324A7E